MSPKVSAGLNLFRRGERTLKWDQGRDLRKRPGIAAGPFLLSYCVSLRELEIHTTHAAARRHAGAGASVLLRRFRNHGFGGDQECRN
jgi:hypothetical protein